MPCAAKALGIQKIQEKAKVTPKYHHNDLLSFILPVITISPIVFCPMVCIHGRWDLAGKYLSEEPDFGVKTFPLKATSAPHCVQVGLNIGGG